MQIEPLHCQPGSFTSRFNRKETEWEWGQNNNNDGVFLLHLIKNLVTCFVIFLRPPRLTNFGFSFSGERFLDKKNRPFYHLILTDWTDWKLWNKAFLVINQITHHKPHLDLQWLGITENNQKIFRSTQNLTLSEQTSATNK